MEPGTDHHPRVGGPKERLVSWQALPAQARTAFGEAARIIQGLAQGIKDETLRARFLAGPQIHPVMQHAQRLANEAPQDHAEQSEL